MVRLMRPLELTEPRNTAPAMREVFSSSKPGDDFQGREVAGRQGGLPRLPPSFTPG